MSAEENIAEVPIGEMANPRYGVIVRPYLFGQLRFQLYNDNFDGIDADPAHGRGEIVRQMCTYSPINAAMHLDKLCKAEDPEAYCEGLARIWNCEHPGGRIRLDNRPEDKIDASYHDPTCPPRNCDKCGKVYTGPAVYCSLECAVADAG